MLLGCNFRADRAAIRVGLVDFQTAQRSILGYGTNRYGVGSGITALGHNDRCRGRAINQGDCNRLSNTAFAGSGRERDTLGPYGHHQLVVVAARCKFFCKCTHRSGDAGQVGIVGGQGKEATAVIAVVNRAVGTADGADQAVLGMSTGIENLLQLSAVSSGSIGIDLNEGHAARCAIVGGVAVQFAGFGQISRGNQNRALGIT